MRPSFLKILSILLSLALIICSVFLVRLYWQIYFIGGWKDQVMLLAGSRGTRLALDDFRAGKLRLFELSGEQYNPKYSGRRDDGFEIWYPQFHPILGLAHRFSTEEFVKSYNDKMRYMHEHPAEFKPKITGGTNNSVELIGSSSRQK